MIGGSTTLFLLGGRRTQAEEDHTLIHGLVPLFAAISDFAMARHQGDDHREPEAWRGVNA